MIFDSTDADKKLNLNFTATIRLLGSNPEVNYVETAEYICCKTPCKSEWLNGVVRSNFEPDKVKREVELLVSDFQSNNVPSLWHIGALSSNKKEIEETLSNLGLEQLYTKPTMALTTSGLDFTKKSDLKLHNVHTQRQIIEWYDVFCESFGLCEADRYFLENANKSMVITEKDPHQALIGYYGGIPACIGSIFFTTGFAAVYNVSTLKEFRLKGFARDMTLACIEVAKSLGYKLVGLSSTEEGVPLYEKIGFKEVGKIKVFRIC